MRARALLVLGAIPLALAAWTGTAGAQEDEPEISHDAEECIHILEDGGEVDDCQEAPNIILPATDELIWGGISFTVLMVLMAKFAFPAVRRGMENRTERIRNNLDDAERTRAEAQRVLEEYQRQLADARNEAARIIEDARQTADALRRDLEAKAQAEIAEGRQRMNEQLGTERERVMAEISDQVKGIAIELAEKVVEASLDREANMRLIDSYIEQVGNGR
jgi:F-type H+-transporting ATPase subunit b